MLLVVLLWTSAPFPSFSQENTVARSAQESGREATGVQEVQGSGTAVPDNSVVERTSSADDNDFAPGLAVFVFIVILFILAVIGFGAVIGVVVVVLTAILIGVGILTTATVAGLLSRSLAAGFRTLALLGLTFAGIPAGIGLSWVAERIFDINLPFQENLFFGGACGAAAGLAIGFLGLGAATFAYRRLTQTT